jgi:ribose transport system substrate-binding protein
VFCLQHIRYEASLHPEITDIIVTDAAFNPTKQVADIEDLISNQPDPGTGRSTTRRSNRC